MLGLRRELEASDVFQPETRSMVLHFLDCTRLSLRSRGWLQIRLDFRKLAIQRDGTIHVRSVMSQRQDACPLAVPEENKNTENIWRDTLDDEHRLHGAGPEQGEDEFSHRSDIVAEDYKALGRTFRNLQAIYGRACADIVFPVIEISTLHQFSS